MALTFFDYEIPVLKSLERLGGSAQPKDVFPVVEELMDASLKNHPEEYGYYKKQREIIWKNKTRWAREYLKRKGQLDGSIVGIWTITDAGKERLKIYINTNRDPDEGKATIEGIDASLAETEENPEKVFDKVEKSLHETGDILNFRGIVYEPINEQGTVSVFHTLLTDLGFRLEGIRTKFPDAILKRKNDRGNFNPCLAEFEYRASNYRAHGHPLNGCDLVICWENDWPSCPIEILELKSIVKKLKQDNISES